MRKTGRARILLYLIENKLRHFVSSKLRDIDENWLETRIAESIRRSWESNKEREHIMSEAIRFCKNLLKKLETEFEEKLVDLPEVVVNEAA